MSALRDDMPPPTSYSSANMMRPFDEEAFAVVPPMSSVITSSNPARAAKCWAPMTPAAGPHSTVRAGFSATAPASRMAPLDCITISRAADAGALDLGDHGAYVTLDRRADVGVDDRGGSALVFELLSQHVDRERDESAGSISRSISPVRCSWAGLALGVKIADRDRLDAGGPDALHRSAHPRLVEGAKHLAARSGSLVDLGSPPRVAASIRPTVCHVGPIGSASWR